MLPLGILVGLAMIKDILWLMVDFEGSLTEHEVENQSQWRTIIFLVSYISIGLIFVYTILKTKINNFYLIQAVLIVLSLKLILTVTTYEQPIYHPPANTASMVLEQ